MHTATITILRLLALLPMLATCADAVDVSATGCFECWDGKSYRPIQDAVVKLIDEDDNRPDDDIATGTTNSSGCFTLSGTAPYWR